MGIASGGRGWANPLRPQFTGAALEYNVVGAAHVMGMEDKLFDEVVVVCRGSATTLISFGNSTAPRVIEPGDRVLLRVRPSTVSHVMDAELVALPDAQVRTFVGVAEQCHSAGFAVLRTPDGTISMWTVGSHENLEGRRVVAVGVVSGSGRMPRLAALTSVENVAEFARFTETEFAAAELVAASGWAGSVEELADLAKATTATPAGG